MHKIVYTVLATLAITTSAFANEPFGIWQTKTDAAGAYLHVKVEPCAEKENLLCAKVHETFNTPHTEIVGKPVFWDLESVDETNWANGKVWDAATDQVYDAKVILGKTKLRVEGCVSILCDGQNWTRVE